MSKSHANGSNGNGVGRTKKTMGIWAEQDFFEAVDKLRKSEKPELTRTQMIQRLVFQAAAAKEKPQRSAA